MDDIQQDSPTKKERNELRRKEKQEAQEKSIRSKKLKRYIPWLIGILVIGGIGYWLVIVIEKGNTERPGEALSVMSVRHLSSGETFADYNSNPPTSGPHAGAAPWGFNATEVPDINAVHNLEHGGIWISHKDLSEDQVAKLESIANANRLSVLVSPRAANDGPIVVASWGRFMKLDEVDEARITDFIRKNKNKSPEPLAR